MSRREADFAGASNRDRVVSAIYETVLRPHLYDAFMEAWSDHVTNALQDLEAIQAAQAGELLLAQDKELTEHFGRAFEILEQIGRKAPSASGQGVAAASGFALRLDTLGCVVEASADAARLFPVGTPLEVFERHLFAGASEALHTILQGDTATPVVLGTDFLPRHVIARGQDSGVLIEALEIAWTDETGEMLRRSFKLSKAELEVVRNLAGGLTLRAIAEETGRSEHTIRNQTKSILAKTGAPGQVDLVRMVAFLAQRPMRSRPMVPSETVRTMSDGMQMQVFEFGDPKGQPVVFIHGMLDGMTALRRHADLWSRHGLRVIAPIRPGFGLSTAVKRADQAEPVFTAHLHELLCALDVAEVTLLGYMGGAVYAYAFNAAHPEWVAGMVMVSGGVPLRSLVQIAQMAPRQQVVAYTARFAAPLLPPILRAGISQIDGKDVQAFIEALYRPGTHDHTVIKRLGIADLMRDEYRFSAQQGHKGFAADSHLVVRDWSRFLRQAPKNVILVHGRHDPAITASSVEQFQADHPYMTLHLHEDCGQLVFYERPDLVIAALHQAISVSSKTA
ncbi:alpha/beta fold hydrolase [Thalassococcus sp. S3]|uniref:alpha/beta fold hydrolase n=1 Tax=Thalassococcus sp. S3 TaxID=2017482 RepID=UPI0010241C09|nr:alpha/beta fold hydrolase [Thalassococcus sp. S3]QBF32353.1 hypothetical protein CFI11_14190 [Thalassococcus sp. S3]